MLKLIDVYKKLIFLKEEQTMITEMELTGQAYEDMQEQNSRLVQQLREKDEANFKLLSERTQSNKLLKLIREEANTYQEMVCCNLFLLVFV